MTKLCVSRKIEDVLLAFLEYGPMSRTELREKAKIGGQTQKDIVNYMLENGIVEEYFDEKRDRVVLRLTEKGRQIAELVKKIHELLNS